MITFDSSKVIQDLTDLLPTLKYSKEQPLAPYTTVKIGGPAELLLETTSSHELQLVLEYAQQARIPYTILGWGANTLIADVGIRGITIINKSNRFKIFSESKPQSQTNSVVNSRWNEVEAKSDDFFNYYTGKEASVLVEFDSGTPLPYAINQMLNLQLTGLEWFSRIPATIGGAIYNNIHGGSHFISEQVCAVSVLTAHCQYQVLQPSELEFSYDYSRFHHTNEVILSAQLMLYKGDFEQAKKAAIEWAKKKQQQPQNSLGCVFQNLSQDEKQRLGLPTTSVGYLIDKFLHLAGFQIGGAQISKRHAAFIENIGGATANDYLAIIRHIQSIAQKECQIMLKPEIFFRGFEPNEISGIVIA